MRQAGRRSLRPLAADAQGSGGQREAAARVTNKPGKQRGRARVLWRPTRRAPKASGRRRRVVPARAQVMETQITKESLLAIIKLLNLQVFTLVGCIGIDDDALASLKKEYSQSLQQAMGICCSKAKDDDDDQGGGGFPWMQDDVFHNHLWTSAAASMHTKQGWKGANQDAMTVCQDFAGNKGHIFCGVFDGHGPLGRQVARHVRDTLPLKLSSALKLKTEEEDPSTDTLKLRTEEDPSSNTDLDSSDKSDSTSFSDDTIRDEKHLLSTWKNILVKTFARWMRSSGNIQELTAFVVVQQQSLLLGGYKYYYDYKLASYCSGNNKIQKIIEYIFSLFLISRPVLILVHSKTKILKEQELN